MKLARRIFWDVNYDAINWDEKYRWVIVRVFERGDVDDIRQCRRYYGDEKVREALLKARYLCPYRLPLAAAVINEPIEEFRCYALRQLNPSPYPY